MTETAADLGDASLDSLRDAIPERLARTADDFFVEYGIREDDQAMVFHFYRDVDHALAIREGSKVQGSLWEDGITEKLERGIKANFDVDCVNASYVDELDSFCVIVAGLGMSLDPWVIVEKFLSGISEPLEDGSDTGSGTLH